MPIPETITSRPAALLASCARPWSTLSGRPFRSGWTSNPLFGVEAATVALAHGATARLVADGAAEMLEGGQVTLAREQEARAAVVPDGPGLVAAVARFNLCQVVEAEQELDALTRAA